MVVDKPDWSQASYRESSIDEERLELGRIIKEQQARIAELEEQLGYTSRIVPVSPDDIVAHLGKENVFLKERIAELEDRDKLALEDFMAMRQRIKELEIELERANQRWNDLMEGMRKVELWEKGGAK